MHSFDSSFISPSYFKDNFTVDGFLITLTKDVIDPQKRLQHNNSRAPTTAETAQATIDRVQQLLRRFARAEEEISVLSSEVTAKLADIQLNGQQHEAEYKVQTTSCFSSASGKHNIMFECDSYNKVSV